MLTKLRALVFCPLLNIASDVLSINSLDNSFSSLNVFNFFIIYNNFFTLSNTLFEKEFIVNIKIDKEEHSGKKYDVILIYYSNNQEFNTSHGTTLYYINEDKWVGLPHKNEVTRQDTRLLGKIAAVVNTDTKYLKGTGDIEIGGY